MLVAKIKDALALELKQKEITPNWYFNPVKDAEGSWVISMLEANTLREDQYTVIEFLPNAENPLT